MIYNVYVNQHRFDMLCNRGLPFLTAEAVGNHHFVVDSPVELDSFLKKFGVRFSKEKAMSA